MNHDRHTAAIELLRPHRHGGRDYPAGARLRLLPDQADWLCAMGVARPVDEPPAAPARAAAANASVTTTTKE